MRFHFNGNTIGFDPQTYKLERLTQETVPCESIAEEDSFEW